MKETRLTLPEIGLIAVTRGMLGAGVALLLGDKLDTSRRKAIGKVLFLLGAVSTISLAIDIWSKRQPS